MRKILFGAVVLALGTIAVLNVQLVLNSNRLYKITVASLDAMANDENGENTDQESNNEGSGVFFYKHLQGRPKSCTMYRNTHISGTITYTDEELSADAGWTSVKISGIVELCPDKGNGCTAYTCQFTN